MPLPISNSSLLRAVDPRTARKESTAAPWAKAIGTVVNGSAGMTQNLANPIIRLTNPLPTVAPPVPMAVKPSHTDSVWSTVSKALNRSTPQNEQLIRERAPAAKTQAIAPVLRQRSPWIQSVNKQARKIATMAEKVQTQTSPHVPHAAKPVAVAVENLPQLLLSGPSGKMKAANLVVGTALDYGAGSTTAGAAAKLTTPGNSLTSNIAQTVLTPALKYFGF